MNKLTRLLASLDDVFGVANKIKSQFCKIGQVFDERTTEEWVKFVPTDPLNRKITRFLGISPGYRP